MAIPAYEQALKDALKTVALPTCRRDGRLLTRGVSCPQQWPLRLDQWCPECVWRAAVEHAQSTLAAASSRAGIPAQEG